MQVILSEPSREADISADPGGSEVAGDTERREGAFQAGVSGAHVEKG